MPLGEGYTAEEQLSGEARSGGLQIAAHPMRASTYEALQRARPDERGDVLYAMAASPLPDMGLAPGGLMRQEIYDDPTASTRGTSRCVLAASCISSTASSSPAYREQAPPGTRERTGLLGCRAPVVRLLRG